MYAVITTILCTYLFFGLLFTVVVYLHEGLGSKWWHVVINLVGGVLIWPYFSYRSLNRSK